ncbi:hypothetical protein KUCAC02_032903, partial [Chaenocephalus aceratus]
ISGCIIRRLHLPEGLQGWEPDHQRVSPGIDLMIAIGVIILVLGFLGCCGAIRENRCLLLGEDDIDYYRSTQR